MEVLQITWKNIEKYSQIPIEYRFVDKAEVIPGKEARGIKMVSSLDWFFKMHFPGNPMMPGVLLMEMMQQTGGLIITTMPKKESDILFLDTCESMRMYSSVRPGDVLMSHVVLESYGDGIAQFDGTITANDNFKEKNRDICKMKFTLTSKENTVSQQTVSFFEKAESSNVMEISGLDMNDYTADPIEYRFVDKVHVLAERKAQGEKAVSSLDWYFHMKHTDNLFMPTAFIMETIMQTGVFVVTAAKQGENNLMMFHGCKSLKIYQLVRPGDMLLANVKLDRYRHGVADYTGVASVEQKVVCEMKFTLISPECLPKMRV